MPRAPSRARYAIDLHLHSTWSDGTLTPAALVAAAARRGVRTIALTDHDTTDGVAEARAAGAAKGVSIIAGIELSAWLHREIHILGYFVDPAHPGLVEVTRRQSGARVRRVEAICERLAALGVALDPAPIIASAHGNVGRPHIARALVAAGHVASVPEAFDRYLGNNAPAVVPVERLPAADAIALIHAAGGVAVLAHPGVEQLEGHIAELTAAGLDGLEVDHPAHGRPVADRLRTRALAHRLVPTGGSDFHRPEGTIAIGHYGVTAAGLAALRDRRPAAA